MVFLPNTGVTSLDEAMCSPTASVCQRPALISAAISSVLLLTLGLGFQFGSPVPNRFARGGWHAVPLQMPTAVDRELVAGHSEQLHVPTRHGHLCKSMLESTQAGGRFIREFQALTGQAPSGNLSLAICTQNMIRCRGENLCNNQKE